VVRGKRREDEYPGFAEGDVDEKPDENDRFLVVWTRCDRVYTNCP
jgi:hypothetical protein